MSCPQKMADGRFVTDYRENCTMCNLMKRQNSLRNNYDTHLFLQQNGKTLMNMDRQYQQNNNVCTTNFIHPDPSNQDSYWNKTKKQFGL